MYVFRLWLASALSIVCITALRVDSQLDLLGPRSTSDSIGLIASDVFNATATKSAKHHCENIHEAPDQCQYARKYCASQSAGMVDYISWYYCDMSDARPVAFTMLVAWTTLLFSTIGIASSDFFCPNLATIANSLGMSQSVAGVTFLAFGNGSPDVFSTFAAFKAHSGSLAIGELLGAAAFITSVVAGTMAIIAPFKVSRTSFLRDAGFFMIAVLMTMVLLADGALRLWESILMIVFYVLYVAFVLIGTYVKSQGKMKKIKDSRTRAHYAPLGHDLGTTADQDFDDQVTRLLDEGQHDMSNVEIDFEDDGPDDSGNEVARHDFRDLNSSMSITGRPLHTSTNTLRPSLLGALEFRELVTSLAEDGTVSPGAVRSMKRRPRAHSTACPKPTDTKREIRRTTSGTTVKRPTDSRSEIRSLHLHNHMHAHPASQDQDESASRDSRTLARPVAITRSSRSSSRSDSELPLDQIASASLRKHNPIELLSPSLSVIESSTLSPEIPIIKVQSPPDETDPFARAWGHAPPEDSPKSTYNSTDQSPSLESDPHELSSDERPDNDDCSCVSGSAWMPSWWPTRVLPAPLELGNLLFPTMIEFSTLTHTQRLLAILAVPSVFILTITLPVVNPPIDQAAAERNEAGRNLEAVVSKDDADRYTAHRGWNRWLTCLQCLLAPLLVCVIIFYGNSLLWPVLVSFVVGLCLVALTMWVTTNDRRPRFHTWFCFIGFAISVCWISTIANEVVGTLQAFGTILGISDAILGLTVFAVGNSLGDFVADVTVARMGFSQMAISGVFGGPMLNILLGIGISGMYINLSKHHVYNADISATLIVSAGSLLTTLVVLLVAVPANGYVMSRKLGVVLCCIFLTGMAVSVLVEVLNR